MTGELSRTGAGGRVGIWSGAAKTIQGPLLWHFCRLTGLRGRGHYARRRVVPRRGGEGIRGAPRAPPAPRPRPKHRAIHLRYAHKTNRTCNGRPTFPLLLNLFISLLILDLNFNVCEIRL